MYTIKRTPIEENVVNIPRDNFNILGATDEEIENRMNTAYQEWRIKVKKIQGY